MASHVDDDNDDAWSGSDCEAADAEPKVALVAVKKDGLALCHVRAAAQTKDVVLAAVKQNVEALQFVADESLLRDKDVVAAAKKRGVVLEGDDDDDE